MKIALVGYGAMGKIVEECANDHEVVGIVDFNYLTSLFELKEKPDVVIDFSNPANLDMICNYCSTQKVPVVIATTGYSDKQIEQIKNLSKDVAVLYSGNFSLGIILMNKVIREITPILKDKFDIEIIEKHHNRKKDAPSGTAKMFIDTINENDEMKLVHGRDGLSKREPLKEIGVHSIRGGTIVGEHEVIYAGEDEIISIKHEALSRKIFANGALTGAKWLIDKPNGLYNMEDVLFK